MGTRAAAFAPVHDLGLVAIWDDGDDLHAEPRAPYPHAREVLLLRAHEEAPRRSSAGSRARSRPSTCVRAGMGARARPPTAPRCAPHAPRSASPAPPTASSSVTRTPARARVPRTAYDAIRDGLTQGPVLLQTPRQGYATAWPATAAARPRPVPGVLRAAAARRRPRPAHVPLVRRRPSPGGSARSAAAAGCGRRWWGSGAPPRRSGGRSRRSRCAPRAASGCWPPSQAARPSWWRPPVRSRSRGRLRLRGAARHLADAGPHRTCARSRRRCGAGSAPPHWPTRRRGRPGGGRGGAGTSRAAGAGPMGPGRFRRARARRSGSPPTCRRRPGWPP